MKLKRTFSISSLQADFGDRGLCHLTLAEKPYQHDVPPSSMTATLAVLRSFGLSMDLQLVKTRLASFSFDLQDDWNIIEGMTARDIVVRPSLQIAEEIPLGGSLKPRQKFHLLRLKTPESGGSVSMLPDPAFDIIFGLSEEEYAKTLPELQKSGRSFLVDLKFA